MSIYYLEPHPSGGTCLVGLTREQAIKSQRDTHPRYQADLAHLPDDEILLDFIATHWAWESRSATLTVG